MWYFEITTGKLRDKNGVVVGTGYSGAPGHVDNPADEDLQGLGPIPEGDFTIGAPFNSPDHGPFCLRLTPDASDTMYGRDGFLMHGDSKEHPGAASKGCIVQARTVREAVAASGDNRLRAQAVYSLG